ncbi:hypothetical protein KGM_215657 [Danaus plexippus plexippus]|uniref:Protein rolling stone-like n=1 Tax=Danaus plexippus plexippus TaxID=278856 RepID=A0A212EPY3_DANPL|nr:hypothetical protein KGM_215657 [Danaus plexippus plexippus]
MVKFFRKSISISDFWVGNHERLSDFYLTSWQPGDSVVPMLIVRVLLACVATGIFVWSLTSGVSSYWLIYLTNWGLLLVTSMTLSGLLISILGVCHKLKDGSDLPWYISMYWFLYNICIAIAIMITGLYWILLYNPDDQSVESPEVFWLDVATHGLNSCVVFAEVILSRTPLMLLHIYQPLGLGLWYAAFTGIYYAAGGTDSFGNPFIYAVLDWRQPLRAGIIVAASAASLIIVYTSLWVLTLCRDKISTALVRTTSLNLPFTPPDQHVPIGIV